MLDTIICGDCLEVMRRLPDGCVPMIWADPPYGHGNQDGDLQSARVRDRVVGARTMEAEPIANDAGEEFVAVVRGFLDQAARVLRPDYCCCCCCMAGGGPNVTFARVAQWIDEKLAFFQAVAWDKSARGNGMGWRYRRNYELVMVANRKGGRLLWADPTVAIPNVMYDIPVRNRVHPNEKPVSLVMRFIEVHTQPGDIILDPFCGSGTTCVAAKRLGRHYIGIEIDEGYCRKARARLRDTEAPLFGGAP
jgi:DNA modification methylase